MVSRAAKLACFLPKNELQWWWAGGGGLVRQWSSIGSQLAAAATSQPTPSAPRTSVTNPCHHSADHLGLWYTIEPDVLKRVFGVGGMPKKFKIQCQTFGETCLMVRKPALTTIDYIKRSNLNLSPNKFMLYGESGTGKTSSLMHITHFLAEDGWIVVHVPIVAQWLRAFKEITPSTSIPNQYDHPLDSVLWLQHFRSQNAETLNSLQLETSEHYKWSNREATEVGQPIVAIADQGISRARFASDCVAAITAELKHHATHGRCKVAVVVDGINAFFLPQSRFRQEDRSFVPPDKFTLIQAFLNLFSSDWKNGVVVGSVDSHANDGERRKSHLPRYVLRQKGWETLDPFVPIPVLCYDDREMQSVIDYYLDRQWLQSPHAGSEVGRRELAALSNHNPRTLLNVSKSL